MKRAILFIIGISILLLSGCYTSPVNVVNIINQSTTINTTVNETVNQVVQYHRVDEAVASSANTWYNITWDMKVENESTGDYYVLEDNNQTIRINGFDGIVRVQGCIHPYNDYSNYLEKTLRVRTIIDGVEVRCLQASATKNRRARDIDIIVYIGTVTVHNGSKIQIQWMTEDTNIILKGDTVFDNPVAASVNFEKISILD